MTAQIFLDFFSGLFSKLFGGKNSDQGVLFWPLMNKMRMACSYGKRTRIRLGKFLTPCDLNSGENHWGYYKANLTLTFQQKVFPTTRLDHDCIDVHLLCHFDRFCFRLRRTDSTPVWVRDGPTRARKFNRRSEKTSRRNEVGCPFVKSPTLKKCIEGISWTPSTEETRSISRKLEAV